MKPAPTAGILINNYNNEPWLRECIDSALAQTRPADEIIVYDDGSTDDSLAILRSYGDRIRLIEGVHRYDRSGLASQIGAVEAAFAASTSDHLYLLDADDRYQAHHLAACEAKWREAPEAVMVQCAMQVIDEQGRPGRVYWSKRYEQSDYRRAIYRSQAANHFCPTSALAFHRELLAVALPLEIPPTGVESAVDFRLAWVAAMKGRILWIAEPGVDYRQHGKSFSAKTGCRARTLMENTENTIRNFNYFAVRQGHPTLNRWRNYDYLKGAFRALLPRSLGDTLARLKIKLIRMLRGPEAFR